MEDANPDFPGKVLIVELSEAIPVSLKTGVGMIIQAQRDSLDYLAMALAEYNGAVEPRDVYFPITRFGSCVSRAHSPKEN